MPLFLAHLRAAALRDPELGRAALEGLRRYQSVRDVPAPRTRPILHRRAGAALRDCGGSGEPVVLVPSLINPPHILDLDAGSSLADGLAAAGNRVLLLDWGAAQNRRGLDLDGHVEQLLLPLLAEAGATLLVGYCLGGTLALRAAALAPAVRGVATIASPWRFDAYPAEARAGLLSAWGASRSASASLGYCPMEVLQTAFWQIDPGRVVAKYAAFATLAEQSPEQRRFVMLEDWANMGEPLPLPAAAQLVERLFGDGTEGFGPLPACSLLHFTAANDRIAPAATVAPGERRHCPTGHVGMVIGRDAPRLLQAPLLSWLEGLRERG